MNPLAYFESLGPHLKVFASLFAITDPLGLVPIFLSMTDGKTPAEKRATIRLMLMTGAAVLLGAAIIGEEVLSFFGVGLPAFRIAGGIMLFLIAVDMLHVRESRTRRSPEEEVEAPDWRQCAVVPLAVPLFAGPGAIGAVILFSHEAKDLASMTILCANILLVCAVAWVVLRVAEPIGKWVGRTGLNIAIRLMGLLLAAIGVDFFLKGLVEFFPFLGRA